MTESLRSQFRPPHWGWRLLAAAVLVVMVGIGVSVWLPYYREQQIVHEIKGCGGSVYIVTDGPDWLRWLVGEDRMKKCKVFDRVRGVALSSPAGPNAEWAQLKKLSNHKDLYLHVRETADAVLVDTKGNNVRPRDKRPTNGYKMTATDWRLKIPLRTKKAHKSGLFS